MRSEIILIVDDEKLLRWTISSELTRKGFRIMEAGSMQEALDCIGKREPDLVLLDQLLPDGSGIDFLNAMKEKHLDVPVVMLTAIDTSDIAVQAMKLGASDYLTKPVNMEEVFLVIDRALEATQMKRRIAHLLKEQENMFGFSSMVGKSEVMLKVFRDVAKIAQSSTTTVLITGESGTGKELIARAVHFLSDRKDRMFVAINCSALTETLIESELFGYEKGAFTDARTQKKGIFELADTGTIFLDEIGETTPAVQAKLLRVLEEKTIRRIGGTVDISVDVHIVAATNQPLHDLVSAGKFRTDLFYRLNVAHIHLPPVRERGEDALLIADYFLQEFNTKFRKRFKGLSPETQNLFLQYHWPGNVREIRNVVERAVLLDEGDYIFSHEAQVGHLHEFNAEKTPPDISHTPSIPTEGVSLSDVEKKLIQSALDTTAYNQSKAAKLLNISRDALRYKMKKYHLMKEEPHKVSHDRHFE